MKGRFHRFGQGMYLRASWKLCQLQRGGDISFRVKGHFNGEPKTLDDTMQQLDKNKHDFLQENNTTFHVIKYKILEF